jgi:hypothetical protein
MNLAKYRGQVLVDADQLVQGDAELERPLDPPDDRPADGVRLLPQFGTEITLLSLEREQVEQAQRQNQEDQHDAQKLHEGAAADCGILQHRFAMCQEVAPPGRARGADAADMGCPLEPRMVRSPPPRRP